MKLETVSANYDRLAPYYDRVTDLVFHRLLGFGRYREALVDRLGDLCGATVLDIGCGTGNNWPLLVPRVGPSGRVIGVDYSSGMLERARRRIDAAGWSNVELVRDDAATLSGIDVQVDAVLSAWCLGIVHDLPAVLARLVELTRPGGRIAILDFARSRRDGGAKRLLDPLYRRMLTATGIDSPEDVDDEALRERWRAGKAVLATRLPDLVEERYFGGAGLLLHGTRPLGAAENGTRCARSTGDVGGMPTSPGNDRAG